MVKDQLNVLINLATSDKAVAEKEAKIIHMLGKANGISKEEVDEMLKKPKPIAALESLTEDQKFESTFN